MSLLSHYYVLVCSNAFITTYYYAVMGTLLSIFTAHYCSVLITTCQCKYYYKLANLEMIIISVKKGPPCPAHRGHRAEVWIKQSHSQSLHKKPLDRIGQFVHVALCNISVSIIAQMLESLPMRQASTSVCCRARRRRLASL